MSSRKVLDHAIHADFHCLKSLSFSCKPDRSSCELIYSTSNIAPNPLSPCAIAQAPDGSDADEDEAMQGDSDADDANAGAEADAGMELNASGELKEENPPVTATQLSSQEVSPADDSPDPEAAAAAAASAVKLDAVGSEVAVAPLKGKGKPKKPAAPAAAVVLCRSVRELSRVAGVAADAPPEEYERWVLAQAKRITRERALVAITPGKRVVDHWDHVLNEMSWLSKEFQRWVMCEGVWVLRSV